MDERIATVAGGTGLVGSLLVDELLARPVWAKVLLVGRRETGQRHARLEQRLVDFATLGQETLPRADAAFCCLGTTIKKAGSQQAFRAIDLDAVLHFAQACRTGGTQRFFVVTSHGADPQSRLFYNRVKGEVEQALQGLGFGTLGIARPSLLLGDRHESRPGERLAVLGARALRPLLAKVAVRPIEARTVARALIAMADAERTGTHACSNAELHALGA